MTPSANCYLSACPSRIFPSAPLCIVGVDDRQINNSYHPGCCVCVAAVDDNVFYRPHTHAISLARSHTHGSTRADTQQKKKKTFHDIIGFIRSRPKWGSSPVAGLMSMLSPAKRSTTLLLYNQFQSLFLCLSVGLSQQGLAVLMSGPQGQSSPHHIALLKITLNSPVQL